MRKRIAPAAEAVSETDVRIAAALAEQRDRLPVRAWSLFAKLGDQPELRLVSGAVIAAGLVLGRGRLLRAGMRMLLAHEVATSAKDSIKQRIDRTRPHSANGKHATTPKPGRKTAKKQTSFPSGHSAGAVAVAQGFAREFPEHRAPALAAAGMIAAGQIPKRAHYPTDVAAGALLGAASEAVVAAAWAAADRLLAVDGGPTPSARPPEAPPRASGCAPAAPSR